TGQSDTRQRSRSARAAGGALPPGGNGAGGRRARSDSEGPGALRRQCQPGEQGAGPQPQRTLSPAAEVQLVRQFPFEDRIFYRALAAGAAGSGVALLLLWLGDYSSKLQWTLTVFILIAWLSFALSARQRVIFPLRTLSNLLAALREGD